MSSLKNNLKPPVKDDSPASRGKIVCGVANEILAEFAGKGLKEDELAISLIDLTSLATQDKGEDKGLIAELPEPDHYRGEEPIYPASVVKLFYLAAAQQWLEDNEIAPTNELMRACKDMIVESSNDATHYIVDILTGTTGGPELPPDEMAIWMEKRNVINKYFQNLGYNNINVVQKTWGDGPFGRERVFYGKDFANRNKLTTNATARLLAEIATGKCVSRQRSKYILELLQRDFSNLNRNKDNSQVDDEAGSQIYNQDNRTHSEDDNPDDQATGFMGAALPSGARLWSKAGWMSTARHDAAYIELPSGTRFVLVAFVSNHAKEYGILPALVKKIIKALEKLHGC